MCNEPPKCTCGSPSPRAFNHTIGCPKSGPWSCPHPRATFTVGPTTDQKNHHCPDCGKLWTTWPNDEERRAAIAAAVAGVRVDAEPDSIDRAMAYEAAERAKFEKWASGKGFNIDRDPADPKYRDYHRATTRWAWDAWIERAMQADAHGVPAFARHTLPPKHADGGSHAD